MTLGVCVLPEPPKNAPRTVCYGAYLHEILGHAGLGYDPLTLDDLPAALLEGGGLKILVTVGEYPLPDELKTRLASWVTAGGAWLSLGGVCGLDALLGAFPSPPSFAVWGGGGLRALGEGFLEARSSEHPVLADLPLPLHYFGGIAVTAAQDGETVLAPTLDAHYRPGEYPALIENAIGAGRCLLLTPDVTGAIVRIQQGVAVTRDGVPAPDGTAPLNDGVLKSDDGQALDWLLDREDVPNAPGLRAFLQPVADQWRGLVLRAIFYLAEKQNAAIPLLWYYPDNLPALGHVSHDTDQNAPAQAWKLLDTLRQTEIQSTWCVILPGYEPEIIAAIRQAGHELATHFDALSDGCPWTEETFDAQWQELRALFGDNPATNKNHYLRWEGDTEFFDWCLRRGLTMDQSKGASKTGEAGFNFGACHPYRPVAPDGTVLPIHELTTPTQDLQVFAPEAIVPPLLDAVMRQHGILHFLFHPAHIEKPGVADALLRAVAAGRERGLRWWTAGAISRWENARRAAAWQTDDRGRVSLTAAPDAALPGATLLILAPRDDNAAETVERWGFRFHASIRNIGPGETVRLKGKP